MAHRRYLIHFTHSWLDFRVPELRAVAAIAGFQLWIDTSDESHLREGVVLPVRCDCKDDAELARAIERSVLTRHVVEEWASGTSWEELEASLASYPSSLSTAFLSADSTYCIRVQAFDLSYSAQQQLDLIRQLVARLPFQGKVRLKQPQHRFLLLIEPAVGERQAGRTAAATGEDSAAPLRVSITFGGALPVQLSLQPTSKVRYRFGRVIARGARDLAVRYDLKQRNYIGTTSLDAELSLVMANLARVSAGIDVEGRPCLAHPPSHPLPIPSHRSCYSLASLVPQKPSCIILNMIRCQPATLAFDPYMVRRPPIHSRLRSLLRDGKHADRGRCIWRARCRVRHSPARAGG